MSNLRIGTSGWSYPSNPGAWTGIVYPVRAGRLWHGRKFDELAWYADRFDTVEVNSSFYRVPDPAVTRGWAERTPAGFEFSVKLFQKLTHPRMFLDRITAPPEGAKATRAREPRADRLTHRDALKAAGVSGDDIDTFRRAIEPLAAAGKLGALLAQFPPSFKADPASLDYLQWLLDALRDYRVAVELRHHTWSDELATTLSVLNDAQAAWVQIDEPKFKTSIAQNYLPNVTGFYYLRLHGRNAQAWWTHEHAAERYDYLYSSEELDPFVEVAEAVKALVKKMYLYTNNHFAGKSVANASMLRARLGQPNEAAYPPAFVERYPEAAAVVRASATEASPTASRSRSLF